MSDSRLKRVFCIGAANIDRKVKLIDPVQFHTSNPAESFYSSGGVARNVAENLARLQCPVSLISLFGDDQDRGQICKEMQNLNIDFQHSLTLSEQRTGNYICVNAPDGELILATADMSIYDHFSLNWLEELWSKIKPAEWIFVDSNLPADSLQCLIQHAAQDNLALCVDPVSASKAKKLPNLLEGIEILFPDGSEAEAMTGISWQGKPSCREVWKHLQDRGLKKLIISMGGEGIFAATPGESEFMPAHPVPVTDVTGAGDALAAGVIWGLQQNLSFLEACEMGIRNASFTVQSKETVCSKLTPVRLQTYEGN
ncbi:MAG: carbohydrate kinase family protein [SAR324 cluster bacterium]|nr:carbohydrate kinase family protein [SAR324 cluster bacterium]